MADDLRARIAAILDDDHALLTGGGCDCGWVKSEDGHSSWGAHVADVVARELGLTQETQRRLGPDGFYSQSRWVTAWERSWLSTSLHRSG